MTEYKTCTRCLGVQPLTSFSIYRPPARHSWCNACRAAELRARRARAKEQVRGLSTWRPDPLNVAFVGWIAGPVFDRNNQSRKVLTYRAV